MTYRTVSRTLYDVRDAETKERLSYRYETREKAQAILRNYEHTGRVVEVYRTRQSHVTMQGR